MKEKNFNNAAEFFLLIFFKFIFGESTQLTNDKKTNYDNGNNEKEGTVYYRHFFI